MHHGLWLSALLILLLSPSAADAAAAFVQAKTAQSVEAFEATSFGTAFNSSVTAGHGLIAVVSVRTPTSVATLTVSGGCAGTWTQDGPSFTQTNLRAAVWSCPNASAGINTITASRATGTAGNITWTIILLQFSGNPTSNWYDVGSERYQNTASPSTLPTATTAQGEEIIVGGYLAGVGAIPTATLSLTHDAPFITQASAQALTASAGTPALTGGVAYHFPTGSPATYSWSGAIAVFDGLAFVRTYRVAAAAAATPRVVIVD